MEKYSLLNMGEYSVIESITIGIKNAINLSQDFLKIKTKKNFFLSQAFTICVCYFDDNNIAMLFSGRRKTETVLYR